MKCIRCQYDSKYRDRTDRRCPQCRGQFAFEPRAGDPLTDMAFQRSVDAVSAQGRVLWGVEHLYYEVCRRKRISPYALIALGVLVTVAGVVSVIVALAVNPLFWLGPLAALAALAGLLAWLRSAKCVRVSRESFDSMWQRWCKVHGTPAGVIERRPQPAKARAVEPDLADYSFDRAVICDRARTVDLLLANNFHFENNCAVLSAEGYPPGPFETVRAMLKRNPRLQVFALHDATPKGCRLAISLASDPAWFAGQVKVIDVGLRPSHARRFEGLWVEPRGSHIQADEAITEFEAQWLRKYALELAVIRPEQVLKRLFRAINAPVDPAAYAGAVIYLAAREGRRGADGGGTGGNGGDGGGFAAEAGDSDGPADSFG
jgi:hypothetical protein